MSDFQKIDGSKLSDTELIAQSLKFGYKINKLNRIPILDILKTVFDIGRDRRYLIVKTIIHHKIAKYGDDYENDLIMEFDGIKAIQTDNPIAYMEKLETDKNKPFIDKSITITGDVTQSQVGTRESKLRISIQPENIKVAETERQTTKVSFWKSFPNWSKVVIAVGAVAGLIKAIIEWLK
jgi:hypothetical protein